MSGISVLSIAETRKGYLDKTLCPVTVTQSVMEHAKRENEKYNAFCLLDESFALKQAAESKSRYENGTPLSPLDGMIVTVKDWFDVVGWPTRMGSKTSDPTPKKINSPMVDRLMEAGCIFIGKTTLPEYGHKGVTDSPLCGITRNPWNADKTCGGSSGGAAVAARLGLGHIHIGSDAGGSVRIPASFCGVIGFKPSPQVVASYPPSFFSSLSAIGPLSRSVSDVAEVMEVISKPDGRDIYALPAPLTGFVTGAENDEKPRPKIAVVRRVSGFDMLPDVRALFDQSIDKIKTFCDVTEIDLDMPDVIPIFNAHWMAVAHQMLNLFSDDAQKEMDPRFLHWADRGSKLSLPDYLTALRQRMVVQEHLNTVFQKFDFIVSPTTAMTAFDVDQNMPRDVNGELWDDWTPFTYIANLARLPAISLPMGVSENGLPCGLQAMAAPYQDISLLHLAKRIEDILQFNPTKNL